MVYLSLGMVLWTVALDLSSGRVAKVLGAVESGLAVGV